VSDIHIYLYVLRSIKYLSYTCFNTSKLPSREDQKLLDIGDVLEAEICRDYAGPNSRAKCPTDSELQMYTVF
jgi:hypothetical protein